MYVLLCYVYVMAASGELKESVRIKLAKQNEDALTAQEDGCGACSHQFLIETRIHRKRINCVDCAPGENTEISLFKLLVWLLLLRRQLFYISFYICFSDSP